MNSKLNVQSIFDSIDGEANGFDGAGQLTTFIRLKGCNLTCSYCDTKYAQGGYPENWMSVDEIIREVHFPKVTITGGEPLLQQGGVEKLCNRLLFGKSCKVSVETNGTIQPDYFTTGLRYVVDFKLPSSGMMKYMNSMAFNSLRRVDVIKFVISDEEDYKYAKMLIQEHPSWIAKKVFSPAISLFTVVDNRTCDFVPKSRKYQILNEWPRQLAEMMIRDKVDAQFSLQIHKVLWPGAKEER